MFDLVTIGLVAIVVMLTYLYWLSLPPSYLPPGPKGLPFIGQLDLIYYGKERQFHVVTDKWGKQYGGLYNLQCAQMPTLIVTDLKIVRELLINGEDTWSNRPVNNAFLNMVTKGGGGIIMQNGDTLRKMKRLTIRSMRDFGVGKKSIEYKILEEVNQVIKEIDNTEEKPFAFELIFSKAVANVICSVLFGNRYSYDDPVYQKLTGGLNEIFKGSGFQNIFIFLPWYMFWLIPILQPNVKRLIDITHFMDEFVDQTIKEHRETFDKDNLRDFVDIYIDEQEKHGADAFSQQRMFQVILDLFLAGAETTSTTLLWAFLFFVKHPHVQRKCRAEIKEKIGLDRAPFYADKTQLTYVEATICEILRLGNTTPTSAFHSSAKDTQILGYKIPKDTNLLVNIYSIHMSSKHWEEPKAFKPERFLDKSGKVTRPEAFLPFSIGRRACLGENLARMELFLFITGLLQKFEFTADDLSKLPSVDNTSLGITLIPDRYLIRATRVI